MEFEYLSVEDVEYFHKLALDEYGGLPGRNLGKLEGKLSMPYAGYGDFERYQTIYEKAVIYHYYLASGHCFLDGNKRTSITSAYAFLRLNGHELIVSDEEMYIFTMLIANHKDRPPFEVAVD